MSIHFPAGTIQIKFLEMELLKHDRHAEIQKRGGIYPQRTAMFLQHIISGLIHMHSLKLIHRDIKPDNIFITGNIAKIGDFGVTTTMNKENEDLYGTANYMPHDIRHQQTPMSHGADVWETGCVFQLATIRHNKITLFPQKKHPRKSKQNKQTNKQTNKLTN